MSGWTDFLSGSVVTGLRVDPAFAWPWIGVLAGVLAILTLLGLIAGSRGTLFRFLAGLLLLTALINPTVTQEDRQPTGDILLIVTDRSPSQAAPLRARQTELALEALGQSADAIEGLETRFVDVPVPGTRIVDETRVFEAIDQALSDVPRSRLAGIVIISDGQVHDVPDRLDNWAGGAPVHLVLTGRPDERDRRLVVEQAPQFGLLDQRVEVTVRIEDHLEPGSAAVEGAPPVMVTARKDQGEPLRFPMPVGEARQLSFTLDHAGPNVVSLEVENLPGEISTVNNRAVIVVNGVRDRLRVLLVSGEPHPGERTWRNLLKADPSVDLVHFTILRPPEKQDGTPIRELSLIAFPIRELFEIKLYDFDLIIFDRYQRRGVLPPAYLQNIADYVANGGGLLMAEGPSTASPLSLHRSALGSVLPAEPSGRIFEEPFRPELTEAGRRHPVTVDLPGANRVAEDGRGERAPGWGRWFRIVDMEAGPGTTVMRGPGNRPILILNRVGEGRVAQLTSDHIWLWDRGFDGGGPQAELLRRLAHWLMKEPSLEEEVLEMAFRDDRITIEKRSMDDRAGDIIVTRPDGSTERVALAVAEPGLFRTTIEATEPGLYRATDGERQAVALAGRLNPPELGDLRASPERLEPLLAATGGGAVWLDEVPSPDLRLLNRDTRLFGGDWLGLKSNDSFVVTASREVPLWPVLPFLAFMLLVTVGAWWRESR